MAVEKLCGCCYERAWYAKNGGCWAIGFFMEKMPLKWVINHQLTFLMGLLFVLHDLSNEVRDVQTTNFVGTICLEVLVGIEFGRMLEKTREMPKCQILIHYLWPHFV